MRFGFLIAIVLLISGALPHPPAAAIEAGEWQFERREGPSGPSFLAPQQKFAYSAESSLLCVWRDGAIHLLQEEDFSVVDKIPYENEVELLAVDSKNRLYVVGKQDGVLSAYDLSTRKLLWKETFGGGAQWCSTIDFSPDGEHLAIAGRHGVSLLTTSGKYIDTGGRSNQQVTFTPDSKTLVLGGSYFPVGPDLQKGVRVYKYPRKNAKAHNDGCYVRAPGMRGVLSITSEGLYDFQPKKMRWKLVDKYQSKSIGSHQVFPIDGGVSWVTDDAEGPALYRWIGEEEPQLIRLERPGFPWRASMSRSVIAPSGDLVFFQPYVHNSDLRPITRHVVSESASGWTRFALDLRGLRWLESGALETLKFRFDPKTGAVESRPPMENEWRLTFNRDWVVERKRTNVLQVIDRNTGKTKDVKVKRSTYRSVVVALDGKTLVTADGDKDAAVRNCTLIEVRAGRKLRRWTGPLPRVGTDGTCYHQEDGSAGTELIATDSSDKELWRVPFPGSFELSRDGRRVVGSASLLDAATGEVLNSWGDESSSGGEAETQIIAETSDQMFALYFPASASDGKAPEGRLEFRSWETGERIGVTRLKGATEIHSISPDGQSIVARVSEVAFALLVRTAGYSGEETGQ